MKALLKYIILLSPCFVFSQNANPTEDLNGTYHLLESEKGINNRQTFTKLFQYAKWGEDYVVGVAACEKCMPAIYKYKEDYSKALKTAVFYNDIGLYLIAYDKESFVMIMPSEEEGAQLTDFSYSNFYSKDKTKVAGMSQQKIKEYLVKIAN